MTKSVQTLIVVNRMLVLEATVIPAAPGTFLIEIYLHEDRLKTLRHPIIGWREGPNDPIGGPAVPVLLINSHILPGTSYYGIMFENGEIYDTDPVMAGIVDDFDTWIRENVEPAMLPKSSPAEKPAKKRGTESQTTRESATPSKARATSSPILMTPEQEAETDADMAKLEAQARETMARLHKDGVIQGAPPEPAAPKRKPRRTKHVPSDAKDLI